MSTTHAEPAQPAQAPSIVLPSSRTVGFIKHHALKHRLTIERRLVDAGFAIVKERQMQFNPDSDRDMLEELFGNDAAALGEHTVWIYVLERPRAAEVLQSIMGEEDPEDAKINSPNSLRAVYGADKLDNAFGCAIDPTAVDILFASSPVWSPGELPELSGKDYSTIRSVNTAFLAALRENASPEENSDAAMYANLVRGSNPGSATSSVGTPRTGDKSPATNGKVPFRARPVPATNAPGSVQPRMTKAAALRMGIAVPTENRRHSLDPSAFQKQYEGNVPGYKRNISVQVASTAPPVIAPRPTRASQLREGKPIDIPRRQSLDIPREDTFRGVPGHKRKESLAVASTKPPSMAPRANRSALLRQQKIETPPPSSYMFKSPTSQARPRSLSTKSSSTSLGGESESSSSPAPHASLSRSSSVQGIRSSNSAPTIAPRSNRSAELRAAKMILAAVKPARPTRA